MDILGNWKFRSMVMLTFENDKPVKKTLTKDEILGSKDPDIREMSYFAGGTLVFGADGKAEMLMDIPEGTDMSALDDEEKAMVRDGNKLAIQSNAWKEENGKFLIDSGEHREVMGEVLSSWDEIQVNADGSITINSIFPMTFER